MHEINLDLHVIYKLELHFFNTFVCLDIVLPIYFFH